MRKALAAVMAAAMVLSMGVTALAASTNPGEDGSYHDEATVTFEKMYTAPWGGSNPEETFTFTVHKGVRDPETNDFVGKIEENLEGKYPDTLPDIDEATFAAGAAGHETNGIQTLTVTLPRFDKVGVYYYTITEDIPDVRTAGVSYHSRDILLKVTVLQAPDGRIRVAAVHCEAEGEKTDSIENTYKASSLEITKNVEGNMGETDKYFTVKVTLIAPEKTTMSSEVGVGELSYVNAEGETFNPTTITEAGTEYLFKIKDGETIVLSNIPEGVIYTVEEVEADKNGYTTDIVFSDQNKKIDTEDKDTVIITNTKDSEVDTGILLDSAPYILLLAVAVLGMFGFILKKRNEDLF